MEKGILVSCLAFECTEIQVSICDGLAGKERTIGSRIREELDSKLAADLKAAELLLPGALLNTLEMYEELKHCDPSITIFGGYAGNHDADLANAFVMADGKIYPNACIVIQYLGKDFHIDATKSAGWEKLGMPFKITSAEGNLLKEINGIPAAEIYRRYLNIAVDEDFVDNTNEFPIAAYVGDEEILRHTNTVNEDGSFEEKSKWTEIFIFPGYQFKAMQGLITNFHLPESTLVMLVSAFAGRENVLSAYKQAVQEKYRFFSFGDAMFIG